MTQHTPGPWEYDGGAQIFEVASPDMRICFLPSDYYKHASSEANARLIAAAPDMLEALKQIASASKNQSRLAINMNVIERLSSEVIAKATGGA